jgi:hypothetical protein
MSSNSDPKETEAQKLSVGIFGYTDEATEDSEVLKQLSQNKKVISDRKIGKRMEVKPYPEKIDPKHLATNVVELEKRDIEEFKERVKDLTQEYSDFLRKNVLPHVIAFDAAIEYNRALIIDGIGREDVVTDNSLLVSLKWLLHTQAVDFFAKKLGVEVSLDLYEKLNDLMKSELSKSSSYVDSGTVGVVKSRESAAHGNVGLKSSMRRD